MGVNSKDTDQRDLIEAAKSGDRLETLIALRDLLAERLQNTNSSRDISSMSRRLMQCISEIETLERIKQDAAERPNSLRDLRRQLIERKLTMDKQYALNSISAEHENH